MTEVFVQKMNGQYHLMISGLGYTAVAGTRLLKGPSKLFPNGAPEITFTHTSAAEAYKEAERLQLYLHDYKASRKERA